MSDDRPGVLVVVGTRPEAIKMAPVVEAMLRRSEALRTELVLTGQHTDLVLPVLERFGLRAGHDLAVMAPGQRPDEVIARTMAGLRDVVLATGARAILVQGDTASVFAGALVGYLERLWVGHVEAGLRSGDLGAPWPEEGFRRLTDVLADGYFAPTAHAVDNLSREGVPEDRIHLTGNPVVDALRSMDDSDHRFRDDALRRVADSEARLVLLTAHRRESFGAPLEAVFRAVRELADSDESLAIVYPVHPNPSVQGPAVERLSGHPRIHLTDPVDYPDLLAALRRAELVLTDSGGIQEEAPVFGTPVLVLRDVTERPEGVEAGMAELVGTDPDRILERARAALAAGRRSPGVTPYGDGQAGERIADLVRHALTGLPRTTADWVPPPLTSPAR